MAADTSEQARLRLAVSERPDTIRLRAELAAVLHADGQRAEALQVLRDGLLFAADREDRLEALADAFLALDEWPDAIAVLQAAMRIRPEAGHLPARLAYLWAELGEADHATAMAERARALGEEVEIDTPAELTQTLTRQLFNQYAAGFDRHLLDTLRYTAPAELERVLRPYAGRYRDRAIIDLGCGTGLMGERLRGDAGHLTGVDLSPRMLEQAAGKRVYDDLAEADVVTWLATRGSAIVSLITAADVLVYMGNLEPLFTQAARVLVPGGLFAFTVERLLVGTGNYALRDSRRYAHGEAYLRRLAEESDFRILTAESIVPRLDAGQPVDGLVLVLESPAE